MPLIPTIPVSFLSYSHNERKVTCKHPVTGVPSQDNCIFVVNEQWVTSFSLSAGSSQFPAALSQKQSALSEIHTKITFMEANVLLYCYITEEKDSLFVCVECWLIGGIKKHENEKKYYIHIWDKLVFWVTQDKNALLFSISTCWMNLTKIWPVLAMLFYLFYLFTLFFCGKMWRVIINELMYILIF